MSGAGRSVAAGMFEDLGWFVIDNLPVSLVPKIAELAGFESSDYERVALVLHGYDEEMAAQVEALAKRARAVERRVPRGIDDVLMRRYESTKRRHPLADDGRPVTATPSRWSVAA